MKQYQFIKIYIEYSIETCPNLFQLSLITRNFLGDNFVSSAGIDCCSANIKALLLGRELRKFFIWVY